jgi:hypothetical protein
MPDSEEIPDEVPVADAVEQQRPTADAMLGDEDLPAEPEPDVPLEATESDWQEQRETVLIDPELDEPELDEFDR